MTGPGASPATPGWRGVNVVPLDRLAAAIGNPTRMRILTELLGGPPLPAGAIAARAGVAASTVSAHLATLRDAGLVRITPVGRTREASLACPEVAEALEAVLRLTTEERVTSLATDGRRRALREARSCYDHLAGRVGVVCAELALERGWIRESGGVWVLGGADPGTIGTDLGLSIHWTEGRRPAVRRCLDWTERRPHVAGRLGAALLDALLEADWLRRRKGDRALTITPLGCERLTAVGIPPMSR